MKQLVEKRREVIKGLLHGEINEEKAAMLLSCSKRSIERYRKAFVGQGEAGLTDHRHSNYHKLSDTQRDALVKLKQRDRWRSTRNIRDELKLPVSEQQVERILIGKGLGKENLKRVKAIQRFEADYPNEMWQTDIMGKINFPNIGILYLIATLDDCSRFVPSGRWFKTQGKMNLRLPLCLFS